MDSDLEILSKEEDFEEKIPSERELEARMIAMRIRELLRSQKVTDKETGELRNVRYSDPDEKYQRICRCIYRSVEPGRNTDLCRNKRGIFSDSGNWGAHGLFEGLG